MKTMTNNTDVSIIQERIWFSYKNELSNVASFPKDYKLNNKDNRSLSASAKINFNPEVFSKILHIANGDDNRVLSILTASVNILLSKYSYSDFCNTLVYMNALKSKTMNQKDMIIVKSDIDKKLSFKEILISVDIAISQTYKDYEYSILDNKSDYPSLSSDIIEFANFGVNYDNIHADNHSVNCDMIFNFAKKDETLEFQIKYDTRIYTENTVSRISRNYYNLLEVLILNPNVLVKDVEFIINANQYLKN